MKVLTRERERHAWTRWELAIRSRVHPSRIGAIENGRVVPYPVELERIAQALDIADPTALLEEAGDG
jgi:ribosome-binding protein aMBF1 (putative translation factor)